MTKTEADLQRTPRAWWLWGFTFLFLAHAALVFWLGERVRPRVLSQRPEPFLHIAAGDEARARVAEKSSLVKATLFALPNEVSFSGSAWLNEASEVLKSSNWVDSPRALPLPVEELGGGLLAFAVSNHVSDTAMLEGFRDFAPREFVPPSEPISTGSTVIVRGALANRSIQSKPPLPPAHHADLLTNTVVEVQVNGDGTIESAALLGECESKEMNEKALGWARAVRFAPLRERRSGREDAAPTRGRLVFTWHVVPPVAATNAATAMK